MKHRPSLDERGSIVLEAMIAALIVAAMSGALFETVAARTSATRGAAERRQAMLVAQSQLAAFGTATAVAPGVVRGRDGAFEWRVETSPYPAEGESGAGSLALVTVTVRAATTRARPLAVLRSLRLAND